MKKPNSFLLLILLAWIVACQNSKTEQTGTENDTPKEVSKVQSYPSLSNQELTELYAKTDKVDMIFYNLPFSINQDDAKSAKNSVLYVSPAPADMSKRCAALGRISWISDGQIIREADIHLDSMCHYFVFMTNNQPVGANAMAESGVTFFRTVFEQVRQKTQ